MSQKLLQKLKLKLKEEKTSIEKELKKFAEKDRKLKGGRHPRFPLFNGEIGGAALEKAADEIEEYSILLPIEYTLEIKLRNINLALKKMKKGKYGICERCGKLINIRRLKVYPEARTCLKCKKK
ncbi:TraR/DksA C4-type zinc finger protein [Patescibacteria group bacterium]|nr:TraR/DksA C4-type zinc finger protein [Patescibacteria group bacterium]